MERKERLSVRETRAALIESGCDLFLEPRTDWALGRITLSEAINRADVSRASAYRAFTEEEGEPQDAFRLAVLLEVIARTVIDTSVVAETLASLDPQEFAPDPDGQAAELREIIRRWTNTNLQDNLNNDLVRAVDVTRALISLAPDPDPEILRAVKHSLERSQQGFQPYMEALAERYGVRPRSWTSLEQVQRIFVSLTAMAMMEWEMDESTRVIMRPTGPNGEMREWTLSGTLIESLCLIAIEPDPTAEVSANIRSWLD